VEVPVFGPGDIAALEQHITGARDVAGSLELLLSRAVALAAAKPAAAAAAPPAARPVPARVPRAALPAAPDADPSGDGGLKPSTLRVLEALAARHPMQVTRAQLATLSRMKRTGGAFQSHYSALLRGGYITEAGGLISVTPAGLDTAGVDAGGEPATGEELRDLWRGTLKPKAWTILELLLAAYPGEVEKPDLAEAVSMAVAGGGFQSYLTTLTSNGLAEVTGSQVRAADVFFLTEAGADA
jgi:hypothetical protein